MWSKRWLRFWGVASLGLAVASCRDAKLEAMKKLEARGVEVSAESLLRAVKEGDRERLELLLTSGVHTAQRDERGWTPLHVAIENGELGMVETLIGAGADGSAATPEGITPVSLAVVKSETVVVHRLLDGGASPEGMTPDGDKVLPWAIRNGQVVFVRRLMKGGTDPHQKDAAGNPLTHVAVEAGRRDLALELLRLGADPAERNARGESLLVAALRVGWRDWLDELVQAGADPNLPDRDGKVLLEKAVEEGDEALARDLAALGALPSGGRWGVKLWEAWQARDEKRLRLWLACGAPVDMTGPDGRRPIEWAVDDDHPGWVHRWLWCGVGTKGLYERAAGRHHLQRLLLTHGVGPATPAPPRVETLMGRAIREGDLALARWLMARGVSPLEPLEEGQAPLAVATALGKVELVREFLRRGADPNQVLREPVRPEFTKLVSGGTLKWLLKNDRQVRPIMLAASGGEPRVARALIEAGAKTGVWTARNRMWPVNLAARRADVKMMRILLGKDPEVEHRTIVVDLSEQKAWVYDASGMELFQTKVSTGRPGFATPTGTFAITNKYRDWTSTIYDASMPFFQRLSCTDFGFHQGVVPGYPASHGCIRVPYGQANKLFSLTELGDRVIIQP